MARHGEPLRWLLDHVEYPEKGCLIWPFARDGKGYGSLGKKGAHRRMCEIVNGPAPTPKHHAAHSCGNGHLGCVHPRHVRWATCSENQMDRFLHGTATNQHGPLKRRTSPTFKRKPYFKGFIERDASLDFL